MNDEPMRDQIGPGVFVCTEHGVDGYQTVIMRAVRSSRNPDHADQHHGEFEAKAMRLNAQGNALGLTYSVVTSEQSDRLFLTWLQARYRPVKTRAEASRLHECACNFAILLDVLPPQREEPKA